MAYIKNSSYCDLPFSPDTPYDDFYVYSNIAELAVKCEIHKETLIKCRTIGILQSLCGRFFLSDIYSSTGQGSKNLVQLSVVYLKTPPQSTVIPYPVQVFGTVQWKNRPVIFATLLQVLTVPIAIRLKQTLDGVQIHLARSLENTENTS